MLRLRRPIIALAAVVLALAAGPGCSGAALWKSRGEAVLGPPRENLSCAQDVHCVAHRGLRGKYPENTLGAFAAAIAAGADMVEFDVRRSKDGQLVVIHDRRTDRMAQAHGLVSEMSAAELRALKLGGGERIPLVQEVLVLAAGKVMLNIEIKEQGVAAPLVQLIEQEAAMGRWRYEQFIISSFNQPELMEVRRLQPKLATMALMCGTPFDKAAAAEILNAEAIGLSIDAAAPELVEDAHRRGMRVFVYTLNAQADIEAAIASGANGIITDLPDGIMWCKEAASAPSANCQKIK